MTTSSGLVCEASPRAWVAVTIAVDGHLPADTQACLRTLQEYRVAGVVGAPGPGYCRGTSTEEDCHG